VFVLDTPGVLVPNIDNIGTGLKLALPGKPSTILLNLDVCLISVGFFCQMSIDDIVSRLSIVTL
jgi:hypothetical protein